MVGEGLFVSSTIWQLIKTSWRLFKVFGSFHSGDAMERVWHKLKGVKQKLKQLHLHHFRQVHINILKWQEVLDDTQSQLQRDPLDSAFHAIESNACVQLQKWKRIEMSTLRQKARIQWLKEGDSNTRYFHSAVKARTSRNRIDFLQNDQGSIMVDKEQIRATISVFYKTLLGSSARELVSVDVQVLRAGPQISHAQALELIQPVNMLDVEAALKGIDDSKSPGIDGFNSFFFKQAWPIVKFDIFDAVAEFFCSNSLYSPVNITTITLVPKVANACQVKDFRPISCCSVVYKIIAKIFTARLQKVVGSVVSSAQSGFITGRQIMDNVLLATDLIKGYSWSHISPRCMIKLDMASVPRTNLLRFHPKTN